MDTDNPVVRLCAQGMEAEQAERADEARALFEQAWEARGNDYEGCIAAHYVARHQPDDQATFTWNLTALRLADAARAGDHDIGGFYPSLHLNMASSYQLLGDRTAARAHLVEAGRRIGAVPEGPYKQMVRAGIRNVTERLDA
jgi:hypothetical protein